MEAAPCTTSFQIRVTSCAMHDFHRFTLRTTDIVAAKTFYESVLSTDGLEIVPLPPTARAKGAPSHWMGHIAVDDVASTLGALVERGALALGPIFPTQYGGSMAILKDPGGAVLGLSNPHPSGKRPDVCWHQLNTENAANACANYRDLFGWKLGDRVDLGKYGVHQHFAWNETGADAGTIVDVAELSGVHTHWLFYFQVPDFDAALKRVRDAGCVVIGPTTLDSGVRVVVCDDPQGAAFGLREGV